MLKLPDSIRILFSTWWIYIVIIGAFYTANLTAFLTFNGLDFPISGVESLDPEGSVAWVAARRDSLVELIKVRLTFRKRVFSCRIYKSKNFLGFQTSCSKICGNQMRAPYVVEHNVWQNSLCVRIPSRDIADQFGCCLHQLLASKWSNIMFFRDMNPCLYSENCSKPTKVNSSTTFTRL